MGKWRELTETERTRSCSFCGACPGQRCKTPDGFAYQRAHAAREPDGRALIFTFRLTSDPGGGFTAECRELPGCFSQGETLAEALRNVADAAAAMIELEEAR